MQDSGDSDPKGRPEEPKDRHKVLWIYVLFLGGGVVIFFLGGLLLRNPNLPSYLYSAVTHWLKNQSNSSSRLPSPSPKTAEDYLALTHYDASALPPNQKAMVLALANATSNATAVQDRLIALEQMVRKDLPSLKSADAISAYAKIKSEAATLLDAASQQKLFFENLQAKLAEQLEKNDLSPDLAKQVAALFYQGTPGQKAVDRAATLEKLASELLAVANLLAETPEKWSVSFDGSIHSSDKKLDEEYKSHRVALDAATAEISKQ
jgi:hypothetical protein